MPALRIPVFLFLLGGIACGSGKAPSTPAPEIDDRPRVRIENRSSLDMDIYLLANQRVRLGFAAAGETTVFALPVGATAGALTVRFEARPVRRSGQPVISEPFGVRESDEIVWLVPPQ